MPSTSTPSTAISPGSGPHIIGGGAGAANASLSAHISNPTNAHPASAILYAGGGAWADGTTNPSISVEGQLDKNISDLARTTAPIGANRIGVNAYTDATYGITYNATNVGARLAELALADYIGYADGPVWADSTANPDDSVGNQIDNMILLLSSQVGSGVHKIGASAIANTSATIPAGTLRSQLVALSLLANLQYAAGTAWRDTTPNPAATAQAQLNKIISDLGLAPAGAGASGADKVGLAQRTAWLGGRPNPGNIGVQEGLDKVVTDLGANSSNTDDGAERIGAAASGGLTAGSVRSQLDELEQNWGKLDRGNVWEDTQTFSALGGDQVASIGSGIVPTARKLFLEAIVKTSPNVYLRIYTVTAPLHGMETTINARWNGTNWSADDTTAAATRNIFEGNGSNLWMQRQNTTTVPWTNWDEGCIYGTGKLDMDTDGSRVDLQDGNLRFTGVQSVASGDSNPPATSGHTNTLKASNTPKLWARITTGGGGPTINDGFNIGSATYSGPSLVVNFANSMADTNYCVVATVAAIGGFYGCIVNSFATGSFEIDVYDDTGAQLNLSAGTATIMITVMGKQ